MITQLNVRPYTNPEKTVLKKNCIKIVLISFYPMSHMEIIFLRMTQCALETFILHPVGVELS